MIGDRFDARIFLAGRLPDELQPGIYQGKDGERYRVHSDGATYVEKYRVLQKRDKDGKLKEWRRGPTMIRVGRTRIKASADKP